tara:strand:- start:12345 stop:12983 length:639 start_codon:yes stop_codon:yes gene_type:complete
MILFLDERKQAVIVYKEDGSHEIPFTEINSLDVVLDGQEALYVTSATEVEVTDVVSLVYQLAGQEEQIIEETEDTRFYLWSNNKNKVIIEDINLTFLGKADFKLYDEGMKRKISNSPTLSSLVKRGKIQIVGERKKRVLQREANKENKKDAEIQQKKVDASLDSMIIDKPVADFDPASDSDAIGIDITDEVSGTGVRQIGGGGLPNESGLVE